MDCERETSEVVFPGKSLFCPSFKRVSAKKGGKISLIDLIIGDSNLTVTYYKAHRLPSSLFFKFY